MAQLPAQGPRSATLQAQASNQQGSERLWAVQLEAASPTCTPVRSGAGVLGPGGFAAGELLSVPQVHVHLESQCRALSRSRFSAGIIS